MGCQPFIDFSALQEQIRLEYSDEYCIPLSKPIVMKHSIILASLLISPWLLDAQDTENLSKPEVLAALREAAGEQEMDFDSAYDAAVKAGLEPQYLLESKVVRLLGGSDLEKLLAMVSSIEANAENFEVGGNGFFADRDQVYGLVAIFKALSARQNRDWEAFEAEVKEGFWRSPELTNMFGMGRLITERREQIMQEVTMANLVLPMRLEIVSVDGSKTSLAEMVEGGKAVLLDFWASWCAPCIALMPELKNKAEKLPSQGVAVAGMNTDRSNQMQLAKQVQEKHGMDMPWLLEPESSPFSSALMINSIPRMILVNPQGGVLFNGHPMDPQLSTILASLGVTL